MRLLVCSWSNYDPTTDATRFVSDILPKATRMRAHDTFIRAFQPRFLTGSPSQAWRLCLEIEQSELPRECIPPFYYWITARAESILYRFASESLFETAQSGFTDVSSPELASWIRETCAAEDKVWSDVVNIKVARAMLAALRDFGILEGTSRKRIASYHLPLESFCLIAFCLREVLQQAGEMTQNHDWRLFLFSPTVVDRLLLEAHQQGWLDYQSAGGISRIEFPAATFEAYVKHLQS